MRDEKTRNAGRVITNTAFAMLAASAMLLGLLSGWVPQAQLCEAVQARVDLPGTHMFPREWREHDAVAQVAFEQRVPRWRTRRCLNESAWPLLP